MKTLVEAKKPKRRKKIRSKKSKKETEDLPGISTKLFEAAGKEAYYIGDLAIHNLEELLDHIDKFTEKEARWLASWIEYLGDPSTAEKIRGALPDFKVIITNRHKQLSKNNKK